MCLSVTSSSASSIMSLTRDVKFPAAFHSTKLPLKPCTLSLYYVYIHTTFVCLT